MLLRHLRLPRFHHFGIWCSREDSNLQGGLLRLPLRQVRLPFRHDCKSLEEAPRCYLRLSWVRPLESTCKFGTDGET